MSETCINKRLIDGVDYFVNVAQDAECYVNINNSSPCDDLSPSTSQSIVTVQLSHSAMIAFGRLRVCEPCDGVSDPLRLRLLIDGNLSIQHTVRNVCSATLKYAPSAGLDCKN